METVDIVLVTLILGGAFWLLYRSLWKKKGHCQGGCSGSCDNRRKSLVE